ncbi:MAG: uroporphyrinogen-III synthase [Propionibacteriaceae bacterium]|nr:uroporphyrinogen-III synthase [Propionibacteriaceae bacterium]
MKIRLGTKNSIVDVARSEVVAEQLRGLGHDVDIIRIPAAGDAETIGALRLGLMRGDFDLVVHRMHRIPQQPMPGLTFAAVLRRGDHRDALVTRDGTTLANLPEGSVVATRSNLRRAQLLALNPGLKFVERTTGQLLEFLDKVKAGEIAAVVAGAADFEAVGRLDEVTEYLSTLPAAGLGAIGLECRSEDTQLVEALAVLDHADTRVCVMAERAAVAALNVADSVAVAARAHRAGVLSLLVAALPGDGSKGLTVQMGMPTSELHAVRTARKAAAYLRFKGAEDLGRPPRPNQEETEDQPRQRVTELARAGILVPREEGRLVRGLREFGLHVTAVALQHREVLDVSSTLDGADWLAFTSVRAAESIRDLGWTLPKGVKIAAVGAGTADALRGMGYEVDLVPDSGAGVRALLEIWPDGEGTVLVPGSALLAPSFISALQAKGWNTQLIPIYTMQVNDEAPQGILDQWNQGAFDAVIVTSGSNAIATGRLLGWNPNVLVFAIGDSARLVLERAGVPIAGYSDDYSPDAVHALLKQVIEEGQAAG